MIDCILQIANDHKKTQIQFNSWIALKCLNEMMNSRPLSISNLLFFVSFGFFNFSIEIGGSERKRFKPYEIHGKTTIASSHIKRLKRLELQVQLILCSFMAFALPLDAVSNFDFVCSGKVLMLSFAWRTHTPTGDKRNASKLVFRSLSRSHWCGDWRWHSKRRRWRSLSTWNGVCARGSRFAFDSCFVLSNTTCVHGKVKQKANTS